MYETARARDVKLWLPLTPSKPRTIHNASAEYFIWLHILFKTKITWHEESRACLSRPLTRQTNYSLLFDRNATHTVLPLGFES